MLARAEHVRDDHLYSVRATSSCKRRHRAGTGLAELIDRAITPAYVRLAGLLITTLWPRISHA